MIGTGLAARAGDGRWPRHRHLTSSHADLGGRPGFTAASRSGARGRTLPRRDGKRASLAVTLAAGALWRMWNLDISRALTRKRRPTTQRLSYYVRSACRILTQGCSRRRASTPWQAASMPAGCRSAANVAVLAREAARRPSARQRDHGALSCRRSRAHAAERVAAPHVRLACTGYAHGKVRHRPGAMHRRTMFADTNASRSRANRPQWLYGINVFDGAELWGDRWLAHPAWAGPRSTPGEPYLSPGMNNATARRRRTARALGQATCRRARLPRTSGGARACTDRARFASAASSPWPECTEALAAADRRGGAGRAATRISAMTTTADWLAAAPGGPSSPRRCNDCRRTRSARATPGTGTAGSDAALGGSIEYAGRRLRNPDRGVGNRPLPVASLPVGQLCAARSGIDGTAALCQRRRRSHVRSGRAEKPRVLQCPKRRPTHDRRKPEAAAQPADCPPSRGQAEALVQYPHSSAPHSSSP